MRNKGFTLVELLGVLVILTILTMLIVPNVSQYLSKFKGDSYEKQIESIELAAKNWASDHGYDLPTTEGDSIRVNLINLKEGGYLDLNIKNPQTGEKFSDDLEVKITRVGKNYTYEVLD